MNETLKKDYETTKSFWNSAFFMDEDAKKAAESGERNWETIAPSKKLFHAAQSLGQCEKMLDYGCGRGWAAIIAAKSGCANVTAVEVSENAAESARFHAKLHGVEERVSVQCVSDAWIGEVAAESYDGIFCSNVLDVIPEIVAESIIANFARIARKNAPVIIGMNYYMQPKENPEKKMTIKNGNHVFLDDVLRLVSRTDEEWTETFSRYFAVERLEHFAWPGEENERRRLFYLRKN